MFSATKFLVAGAIVALFGGFLLAGVQTQPSEGAVPAVGATASITPPASEEATSLAWERVEIPDGLADTWVDLQSTGTHFVASSWDSPGQAFVSRDGLSWSALPIEGEFIGGYQGTLLVLNGRRLSTVRLTGDDGVVGDGLLAIESLELPFSGLGVMGSMGHATAYGPRGLVVAADDGDRQTSIVWHTDDGRSWEQVYETEGEEWEEVIATPDGFVATSYREDDFAVLHSTDGRDWVPLHEPSPDGYYKLAGSAAFGTLIRDLSGGDGGSRALLVGRSDGMEALTFPAEVETRLRARTPDSWGVGGLGAVGLFIPDGLVAYSVDGTTWHPATLPDEVPLLQGWNRIGRSTPHVAQDAVLLSTRACLGPGGIETECEDPYAEGDKPVWFRGTPSASTSAPETPAVDDLTPDDTSASTPDLLPGVDLVTEEVEPGVYRVLSDGVRDLTTRVHDVTVTPEGDVWLEIAEFEWWSLVRLGEPGVSERFRFDPRKLGLTSEGIPAVDGTRVFDGTGWPITGLSAYDACILASRYGAVAADGSCWERGGADNLVRIEPDGVRARVTRAELGLEPEQDHLGSPVTARDGTVWTNVGRSTDTGGVFDGLLAYDGSASSFIPYDGDDAEDWDYRLSVGLDGVVWFGRALDSNRFYSYLTWDGEAWTDHGATPETALPSVIESTALAHAPDGSVWAVIDEQLHVITPEAVVAAE